MNFDFLFCYWPLLTQGGLMTLGTWLISSSLSLLLGTFFGIFRSNRLRIKYVAVLCNMITFIIRGIPFYVQLLIAYFVLPTIIPFDVPVFLIVSGSLGLCSSAYTSQIIKGAFNAIEPGQWEAGQVLGFTQLQSIRYIILPQVIRAALPALIGECDQVLKSTSIFSALGVLELTRASMNIISRHMNPIPVYLCIALIYLGISAALNFGSYLLEQKINGRINL